MRGTRENRKRIAEALYGGSISFNRRRVYIMRCAVGKGQKFGGDGGGGGCLTTIGGSGRADKT